MGYNTAVIVMNDAVHDIEHDPEFGRNLVKAIGKTVRGEQVDVPTYTRNKYGDVMGVHCNAATVVSTAHADEPQVVVFKHNTGYVYRYKEKMPDHVLADLERVLEQHGYKVSKPKLKSA
jgi:hypothetical protein